MAFGKKPFPPKQPAKNKDYDEEEETSSSEEEEEGSESEEGDEEEEESTASVDNPLANWAQKMKK